MKKMLKSPVFWVIVLIALIAIVFGVKYMKDNAKVTNATKSLLLAAGNTPDGQAIADVLTKMAAAGKTITREKAARIVAISRLKTAKQIGFMHRVPKAVK